MMKHNHNRLHAALMAGITVLALLAGASSTAMAQDLELDRIRAVVNDDVVLDSELRQAMLFFKIQAQSTGQSLPPDDVIEERLLEQLIAQKVREQHARQLGVSVDQASLNRAVEQIANNNNMDTSRFRETLAQQGFDYNLFRDNIEQELTSWRMPMSAQKPLLPACSQVTSSHKSPPPALMVHAPCKEAILAGAPCKSSPNFSPARYRTLISVTWQVPCVQKTVFMSCNWLTNKAVI